MDAYWPNDIPALTGSTVPDAREERKLISQETPPIQNTGIWLLSASPF
jgi:hypothetical protein